MLEQHPSFSLRNKLIWALLFFSLFVGTLRVTSEVYGQYQRDKEDLFKRSHEIIDISIQSYANSSGLNSSHIFKIAENLKSLNDVSRIVTVDENGNSKEYFYNPSVDTAHEINRDIIDPMTKIKKGTIKYSLSFHGLNQSINKRLPKIIFAELIKIFLIILFLFFIIQKMILSPLQEIFSFLKKRNLNDTSLKLFEFKKSRNDEFHLLSEALNELLQENARNIMKIEQANELLEMQVKARTEQYKTALEKSNRLANSRTHYFANISHDLRTPLNSIILLSKLLHRNNSKNLDKSQVEQLNVINESGNQLLGIINDLIDISKYEAGNIKANITKVNSIKLSEFFNEIYKEKSIPTNATDEVIISTDLDKLCKVIKTIIDFSLSYHAKPSLKFSSKNENLSINVELINFDDKDFEELLEFLSFKSVENLLRLSQINSILCRYYLKFLKADYVIKKSEDRINIFIDVPNLEDSNVIYNAQKDAMDIMSSKNSEDSKVMHDIKIALLDDEEDSVFTLQSLLESDGASVQAHTEPLSFLNKVPSNIPDIAIVDQRMPVKTGMEVIEELREKWNINIPIIIMSGDYLDDNPLYQKFENVHFMLKPIDYSVLTKQINELKAQS